MKQRLTREAKCGNCGRRVHEGAGVQVLSVPMDRVEDVFATAQKAAEEMLTERRVCGSCQAVFCLECGNAEGRRRGLGSTNCPACGDAVR